MSKEQPGQGDLFDELIPKRNEQKGLTMEDELRTSYLLVNVLLGLLVQKGVITQAEVDTLLAELYAEYKARRKVG
ncbi:hypothetical protein SAMN02799624_05283 [Paenibacillus sp. UNC496MF]|uniref:hypothetical protein n=1 Tax=Paenibacillus sp. UNC496MF TaxID=1502753 RepID=UPI0008E399D8|nr:hypothetical protein [Paenibacillus sp. UNC496MF]SFJ63475.1 hypothetical protein SAMN02799624_05283 [Paenibacillus sp. UNC496MF]